MEHYSAGGREGGIGRGRRDFGECLGGGQGSQVEVGEGGEEAEKERRGHVDGLGRWISLCYLFYSLVYLDSNITQICKLS